MRTARWLLALLLLSPVLLVACDEGTTPGESALLTSADDITTTVPAGADTEQGTSPWVLVAIGTAAGALVGVVTGLSRRRRLSRGG